MIYLVIIMNKVKKENKELEYQEVNVEEFLLIENNPIFLEIFKEEIQQSEFLFDETDESRNQKEQLKRNPEYMQKAWYDSMIQLGYSHDEASDFANSKAKIRFGR